MVCVIGTTMWSESFVACFEDCCPDSRFLTALLGLWRRRWIGSLLSFPLLNVGRSSISISQVPFSSFLPRPSPQSPCFFCASGDCPVCGSPAVGRVTVFECANLRYCPRARRSHGDPANMTRENVCWWQFYGLCLTLSPSRRLDLGL